MTDTFWQKFVNDNLDKFMGLFIFLVILTIAVTKNSPEVWALTRDAFLVMTALLGFRKAAQNIGTQNVDTKVEAETVKTDSLQTQTMDNASIKTESVSIQQSQEESASEEDVPSKT